MENYYWRILVLCVAVCTASCYSTEGKIEIKSDCNTEVTLPCTAVSYSIQYTSITWYKVNHTREEGIIKYYNGSDKTYVNYDANLVFLTKEKSLILKNASIKHSGTYKCFIAAKVGYRNNHSLVILNVSECVNKTPNLVPTTVCTPRYAETNSTGPALAEPVEVNIMWIISGFIIQGLSKILFSFVCVRVVLEYKKHKRSKLWT